MGKQWASLWPSINDIVTMLAEICHKIMSLDAHSVAVLYLVRMAPNNRPFGTAATQTT